MIIHPHLKTSAFARTDLLAIVGMFALLSLLLVATMGASKGRAQRMICAGNLQQLQRGYALYAANHVGNLVENTGDPTPRNWVLNYLDWSVNPDIHTAYGRITNAALYPYVGNTEAYRCPSDVYLSAQQRNAKFRFRNRSYSMNWAMGPIVSLKQFFQGWNIYTNMTQVANPGPSMTFVFIEEHADSINDGMFMVDPASQNWIDFPAGNHDSGVNLSFADGHVEHRRWRDRRTVRPVRFQPPNVTPAGFNADLAWLQARTTGRL